MKRKKCRSDLGGTIWIEKAGHMFLDDERITLLEKIDEVGSMRKAAMEVGICYKTAWDRIDLINSLADTPLVERQAGGKRGGGTTLTAYGKQMIRRFRDTQDEHRKFLKEMGKRFADSESHVGSPGKVTRSVSS